MSEFVALLHEGALLPHAEKNLLLFHGFLLEELACEFPEVGKVGHTFGKDLLRPGHICPNVSFTKYQDVVLAVQSEWVFEHGNRSQSHFTKGIVVPAVGPAIAVPLRNVLEALGDKLECARLRSYLNSNLVDPNVLGNADVLWLLQGHKFAGIESIAEFSVFRLFSH